MVNAYSLTYSDGSAALTTMGQIQSEDNTKISTLIATPLYGTPSSGTYVFDFGGAQRKIEITGIITASGITGASGLAQSALELDKLINGVQDPTAKYPLIYKSILILQGDYATQQPINVKVERGNWHWEQSYGVNMIKYTLSFIECASGI